MERKGGKETSLSLFFWFSNFIRVARTPSRFPSSMSHSYLCWVDISLGKGLYCDISTFPFQPFNPVVAPGPGVRSVFLERRSAEHLHQNRLGVLVNCTVF